MGLKKSGEASQEKSVSASSRSSIGAFHGSGRDCQSKGFPTATNHKNWRNAHCGVPVKNGPPVEIRPEDGTRLKRAAHPPAASDLVVGCDASGRLAGGKLCAHLLELRGLLFQTGGKSLDLLLLLRVSCFLVRDS